MPFNRLLLCALEKDCSYSEQGVTVSLQSKRDTAVLLFALDRHANDSRKALGLGPDDSLCDVLYYVVAERGRKLTRLLCFVECKGTDTDHAFEQLEATATALHGKLPSELRKQVHWIGAVRSGHGGAPKLKRKRTGGRGLLRELQIFRDNETLQRHIETELGRGA